MAESLDLIFELGLHAKFVDVDLVEDFEEFGDEFFLTNVLILAIPIPRSGTAVVNIVRRCTVPKLLVFILG